MAITKWSIPFPEKGLGPGHWLMKQRTLAAGFIAPCLPTKIDKLPLVFGWRPQGRRRTEHAYAPDLLERCQVKEPDHRHRRLLRARREPRWD
jgi:hypothetical protein